MEREAIQIFETIQWHFTVGLFCGWIAVAILIRACIHFIDKRDAARAPKLQPRGDICTFKMES